MVGAGVMHIAQSEMYFVIPAQGLGIGKCGPRFYGGVLRSIFRLLFLYAKAKRGVFPWLQHIGGHPSAVSVTVLAVAHGLALQVRRSDALHG